MAMLRTAVLLAAFVSMSPAQADSQDPDLIFRKSTTFKLLTPNDKLAVYGIDDPIVDGIACHYTVPEKGGLSGALGLAEQTSDISLACRQYGPIKFKDKFSQGDVVFSESRSLFFKKMQIVRGCDTKRNILVYMTYSDKLIEGSPKNSTSSVPIEPWGRGERHPEVRRFSSLTRDASFNRRRPIFAERFDLGTGASAHSAGAGKDLASTSARKRVSAGTRSHARPDVLQPGFPSCARGGVGGLIRRRRLR